jgi:hypothetical protein
LCGRSAKREAPNLKPWTMNLSFIMATSGFGLAHLNYKLSSIFYHKGFSEVNDWKSEYEYMTGVPIFSVKPRFVITELRGK